MPNKYLILGPEDQDQLPMFWSGDLWTWVNKDQATLYSEFVFHWPPWELPPKWKGILDIETGQLYTLGQHPPHRECSQQIEWSI